MSSRLKTISVVVIIGCVITIGYFVFGEHGLVKYFDLRYQFEQIQNENEILKTENERLQFEAKMLRSNLEFIERRARQKLGLVAANELIIRFPQKESPTAVTTAVEGRD